MEEILIKLSTIASLEKGQTLSTCYEAPLTHNSWSTSFMRTYNREDRRKTIDFIKDIFDRSLVMLSTLKSDERSELKTAIQNALVGVENLKVTYKGDYYVIGLINTMIVEMNKHLCNPIEKLPKDVPNTDLSDFFEAIKTSDYTFIEDYLYDGKSPNIKNEFLQNGLHLVADKQYYNLKILTILLNFDVNVYLKDMYGNTPLYYAISTGNIEAVIKLEEYIKKKR